MIYVDQLKPCMPTRQWPHEKACRLMTDGSIDSLHYFAAKLGLKRSWFQNSSRLPHYNLTEGNRFKAVKLGAMEIKDDQINNLEKAPYQYSMQRTSQSIQVGV